MKLSLIQFVVAFFALLLVVLGSGAACVVLLLKGIDVPTFLSGVLISASAALAGLVSYPQMPDVGDQNGSDQEDKS